MPGYAPSVRNNRQSQVLNALDSGAGSAVMQVYSQPRPATGGSAGAAVLLAELTLNKPAGTVAGQTLTIAVSPTPEDLLANASGTPAWVRLLNSDGAFVGDFSAGIGAGSEVVFAAAIVAGQPVRLVSFSLPEGNP